MAIRNQHDVMVGLEALEKRGLKRVARAYARDIAGPIRQAIAGAKDADDLKLRLLDATRRMDFSGCADGLAETAVTAGLIGKAVTTVRQSSHKA